jgi:preprotein translocase subunit SecE
MGFLGRIKRSVTGIADFFRSGVVELKKVKWPSRQELISYTLVVLTVVLIMTLFLGVIDYGILSLVNRIT